MILDQRAIIYSFEKSSEVRNSTNLVQKKEVSKTIIISTDKSMAVDSAGIDSPQSKDTGIYTKMFCIIVA